MVTNKNMDSDVGSQNSYCKYLMMLYLVSIIHALFTSIQTWFKYLLVSLQLNYFQGNTSHPSLQF